MYRFRIHSFIFLISLLLCGPSSIAYSDSYRDSLIRQLDADLIDSQRVSVLNTIAFNYHRSKPDSCFYYATEALFLAKKLDNYRGIGKAYNHIAIYYTLTGKYDKSKEYLAESISYFKLANDPIDLVDALSHLGVIAQRESNYIEALSHYTEALKYLDPTPENRNSIGAIYGNMGNLYDQLEEYSTALSYFQKGLNTYLEDNDQYNLGSAYGNIGLVYHHQKKYDSALVYLQKSISIDSSINNLGGLADNYGNIANTYKSLRNYEKSIMSFEKALAIDEELNNTNGIAFDLGGISELYLAMLNDTISSENGRKIFEGKIDRTKTLNQALGLALRAELLYQEIQSNNYLIYRTLKDIYSQLGNFKKAFFYSEKYWKKKNEVLSADKAKEFARLEAKAQNDINEKKIELLQAEKSFEEKLLILAIVIILLTLVLVVHFFYQLRANKLNNEKLSILNMELQMANDAKRKFFSILAHDLINPIGGLASGSKIFMEDYSTLSEKDRMLFINAFSESSERAFTLLQNLLEWGRLQKNEIPFRPKFQNIVPVIKDSISFYLNLAKAKNIRIDFEPKKAFELQIDCYMINSVISNLFSNAIKFTPEGGIISVGLKTNTDDLIITIADSGVGMTLEKKNSLFDLKTQGSSDGTNGEKGTGLGLLMVKEFIDCHQGKISIESTPNAGTTFIITLPLNS